MAETLLLRLPHDPDQAPTWLIVDGRGAAVGPPQSGPLNLAAARTSGRRVWVLVPGADVLLAEPELPAKTGTKLAQLVPYALEEHLADDIDDLQFAIGKSVGDTSRTRVAVVARRKVGVGDPALVAVPEHLSVDGDEGAPPRARERVRIPARARAPDDAQGSLRERRDIEEGRVVAARRALDPRGREQPGATWRHDVYAQGVEDVTRQRRQRRRRLGSRRPRRQIDGARREIVSLQAVGVSRTALGFAANGVGDGKSDGGQAGGEPKDSQQGSSLIGLPVIAQASAPPDNWRTACESSEAGWST